MRTYLTKMRVCFALALVLAVCFISCQLAAPSAFAEQSDNQTVVKVGCVEEPGYMEKVGDGEYRGYAVDLMYTIEQYANLNVEFVEFDNYEDENNALLAGDIDLEATVPKSSEYEQEFLFSDTAVGWNNLIVAVPDSNNTISFGDVDACKKLRFAALSGDAVVPGFLTWCSENGFNPDIGYYHDSEELEAAIASGEADAYVTSLTPPAGYHTATIFESMPFYAMYNVNQAQLKASIDNALMVIKVNDPLFIQHLHDRYQISDMSTYNKLTSEELGYLDGHGPVEVALQTNDKPFSYQDSDGTFKGIIPDYYATLSKTSDIGFAYKGYATQAQAIAAVQSGEADVVGLYSGDTYSAHADGLYQTSAYSYLNVARISRVGAEGSSSVALLDRDAAAIGSLISGEDIKIYSDINACYDALNSGAVGSIICELPTATWLQNQHRTTELDIEMISSMSWDAGGAVKGGNNTLRSIMNKAVSASGTDIDGIVAQDTRAEESFQTTLKRIPILTLLLFALLMVAAVILLTVSLVLLRKRQHAGAVIAQQHAEAEEQRIIAEASERSAEEKNAFFSNISHDMRTPLNAITGFVRMAKEKDITVQQREEYLDKAEASSTLLVDLIDDTLTISKANQGRLVLHPEPVRILELFDSVCVPIRVSAEAKDIEFIADCSGALDRTVLADEVNLKKIFLNLLSNAVKYTPEGGHILLRLFDEQREGASPETVIVIQDDGIGVSPEFMAHMFEPFSQEGRHGYETLGTGLGLSIVKELVDLMGGTIDAQSEKDAGSTFTVRLTLDDAAGERQRQGQAEAVDDGDLRGRKALLCEDNQLNLEIAVHLLKGLGLIVDTAENGQKGVERFAVSAVGEYDFVFMDIRMPVMDGLEATRAIRELDRPDAKTVPIIAMTADAFKDDAEKCLEAGMDAHLKKPIDPQAVLETVKALSR